MGDDVACVEYVGFGVSSGSPSEGGCYRSADAAITYLQRQASITLDQIALIGWSIGSAVAIDLASRPGVGHNNMLGAGGRLWSVVEDFLNPPDETG